mmetsp:Transcript_16842/g.46436  ORF Transcript_16842/g.46436 Transcript_16842/m.46436 type:complete len:629 (-) Transcript_16842:101-1987(-)|eukprot:CAMPEP_0179101008 /NCGR_PEP_ID=MMETSP0796-20121207/46678_1 /TAXON_ID=73915 /ORGANISM="Pyrodinium bahamense, Strain pbaha01" /LENGTH=628 /DNA_ID=CAMNT_0020798845 /DNA_START=78 /DNA_END=1964 /DNA_ORIENTATION=-
MIDSDLAGTSKECVGGGGGGSPKPPSLASEPAPTPESGLRSGPGGGGGGSLESGLQSGGGPRSVASNPRIQRLGRLSTRTRECISLSSDSLLRGTRAATVLHRFGQILQKSQGSAETYALSEHVGSIDVFISHNWSTPRFGKFGALALHFNTRPAAFTMLFTCAIAITLTLAGVLPMYKFEWQDQAFERGVACHFCGAVAFLLAILFWHEIDCLRCWGPTVFLDKTCIHQTDLQLKQIGIRSLAAFLRNSGSLLIIYSDTYLEKLWTVYELASHLALHPGGRITLIPVLLPQLVLRGMIFWFLFNSVHILLQLHEVCDFIGDACHIFQVTVTAALIMPASIGLLCSQRNWAQTRANIQRLVEGFSIERAACFCEDDRPVVQGNIASFMQDLQLVAPEAGEAAALRAFDELVREEVPLALAASFGRAGIPYRYVVSMFLGQSLRVADELAPCLMGRTPVFHLGVDSLVHLTLHFAVLPLAVAVFDWAAMRSIRGSATSVAGLGLLYLAIFGTFSALWVGLDLLSGLAKEGRTGCLALTAGLAVSLCVLTRLAYRPSKARPVRRSSLAELRHTISDLSASLRSLMRRSMTRSASTETEVSFPPEGKAEPVIPPSMLGPSARVIGGNSEWV